MKHIHIASTVLSIFLISVMNADEKNELDAVTAQFQRLNLICRCYAQQNEGNFPPELTSQYLPTITDTMLTTSRGPVVYFPGAKDTDPVTRVMVASPEIHGFRIILAGCGALQQIPESEFQKLTDKQHAPQRKQKRISAQEMERRIKDLVKEGKLKLRDSVE